MRHIKASRSCLNSAVHKDTGKKHKPFSALRPGRTIYRGTSTTAKATSCLEVFRSLT
jgi:hypothetical protein